MSDAFGPHPVDPANQHRILGDVQLTSNIAAQQRSLALQEAADNLLDKAMQGMHDGNPERATKFLRRAAELPWDSHEHVHTAALEAHMMLFNAVIDAMHGSAEDDMRWLTVALRVIDTLGERAAAELRSVLVVAYNDEGPTPKEAKQIRAALPSTSPEIDSIAYELPESSTVDEIVEAVEPILEAFIAYYRGYYEEGPHE